MLYLLSFVFLLIVVYAFALNIPATLLNPPAPSWVKDIPIAHRGMHNDTDTPENSLLAFQRATDNGFAIELDVQISKDEEIFVFHDQTMERLTNLKGAFGDHDSEVLSKTKILDSNQNIPTLKQVLEQVNGQVPIYIEIKNFGDIGVFERTVYKVIRDYKGPFAIISFIPKTLYWFKRKAPHIWRGQTSYNFDEEPESQLPWLEKELNKRFLMNWKSKPHFITYKLEEMPNLGTQILSYFMPVLTYGTENIRDEKKALEVGHNFMFDNIGEELKSRKS